MEEVLFLGDPHEQGVLRIRNRGPLVHNGQPYPVSRVAAVVQPQVQRYRRKSRL